MGASQTRVKCKGNQDHSDNFKMNPFPQVSDHSFLKMDRFGVGLSLSWLVALGAGFSLLHCSPSPAPRLMAHAFLLTILPPRLVSGGKIGSFRGSFPVGVVVSRTLYREEF